MLDIIRKLGNESTHLNSGDTDTLSALDNELLSNLQTVFLWLLDKIYEEPERLKATIGELKKSHNVAKTPPPKS